mmetsp:Transcript_18128/g.48768  ORF Transcript_18128/g.48768 Transcript_18128/m.48768 type:complete len:242 (+) Transcript_18128:70-795(+)
MELEARLPDLVIHLCDCFTQERVPLCTHCGLGTLELLALAPEQHGIVVGYGAHTRWQHLELQRLECWVALGSQRLLCLLSLGIGVLRRLRVRPWPDEWACAVVEDWDGEGLFHQLARGLAHHQIRRALGDLGVRLQVLRDGPSEQLRQNQRRGLRPRVEVWAPHVEQAWVHGEALCRPRAHHLTLHRVRAPERRGLEAPRDIHLGEGRLGRKGQRAGGQVELVPGLRLSALRQGRAAGNTW